jgi:hypothetical protein
MNIIVSLAATKLRTKLLLAIFRQKKLGYWWWPLYCCSKWARKLCHPQNGRRGRFTRKVMKQAFGSLSLHGLFLSEKCTKGYSQSKKMRRNFAKVMFKVWLVKSTLLTLTSCWHSHLESSSIEVILTLAILQASRIAMCSTFWFIADKNFKSFDKQ